MATGDLITLASKDFVSGQFSTNFGNITNTSDTDKPVSTAQKAAIDLKADIAGQVFTGDVTVPNLVTSGTVDGRDVSTDGATLDSLITIEEV